MVFICQKNSFLKKFRTTVIACSPAFLGKQGNSKADKKNSKSVPCFSVICEDSVLFPEGGGQPDDQGYLQFNVCSHCEEIEQSLESLKLTENGSNTDCSCDKARVLRVLRQGSQAVMYTDKEISVGSVVLQEVHWQRRLDNMHQHSAQHLISALFEQKYGFSTHSWSMAATISTGSADGSQNPEDDALQSITSTITFNAQCITDLQLADVEEEANLIIVDAVDVKTSEYKQGDPELEQVGGRGLPEDLGDAVIRVVSIGALDHNMCCGTHISNTSQLRAIKLLRSAKAQHKNCTDVTFVAGDRVTRLLGRHQSKLQELQSLLRTNEESVVSSVSSLLSSSSLAAKSSKDALKALAVAEAALFKLNNPTSKLWCHHRKLANLDYLSLLVTTLDDNEVLKVLTAGEDNAGVLLVQGPQTHVQAVAKTACELLEGKGGGKDRFTAKVSKLNHRNKLHKFVEDYMQKNCLQNGTE